MSPLYLTLTPNALICIPSSLFTTTHDHPMSLKNDHSPLFAHLVEPDKPEPLPNRSRAATVGVSSRASIRSLVDVFNHPQRPKSSTIKSPKTPKIHNSYSILSLTSLLHDDHICDEFVRSPPGSPNKFSPTKSRLLRKSRSRILGSIDHTKDPEPITLATTASRPKPHTRNGMHMCPLPVRDVPYPLSYDRVLLQWCVTYGIRTAGTNLLAASLTTIACCPLYMDRRTPRRTSIDTDTCMFWIWDVAKVIGQLN